VIDSVEFIAQRDFSAVNLEAKINTPTKHGSSRRTHHWHACQRHHPDAVTELFSAKWHGADVLKMVYKDTAGHLGTEILFRDHKSSLQVLTIGRRWSFDGDGRVFRLDLPFVNCVRNHLEFKVATVTIAKAD
jgi:hypothetical protein